jgi:hypothetical protein
VAESTEETSARHIQAAEALVFQQAKMLSKLVRGGFRKEVVLARKVLESLRRELAVALERHRLLFKLDK